MQCDTYEWPTSLEARMFQIGPVVPTSESIAAHKTEETHHDVEELQEGESAGL